MLSEISKTEKEILHAISYTWNLKKPKQNKKQTNKPEKPHRNRVEKWLFGAEEWGK